MNGVHRVLIVSPHFPPINAADCHRVRALVPYLRENGWDPEVLAVDPRCVAAPQDQWLAAGIPDDIPIHRVKALGLHWSSVPGLGGIESRAFYALRKKGNELLSAKSFDLIYFSTTAFRLHTLGPGWNRRFSVPFVMDYQDPWVTDYYRQRPEIRPPGGKLKYSIVDAIARWQEPRVLSNCCGITAVSAAYGAQLRHRYPFMKSLPELVIPFPGSQRDFQRVTEHQVSQSCFNPSDGKQHWVYIGVSGSMMQFSQEAFFAALGSYIRQNPRFRQKVALHFVGTSYAPAGTAQPVVKPLAAKYGLDDIVHEQTDRIPYSQALRCMLDADVLLVPGSDDPTYNASKLFPYLLARKPTLVLFHEESPVKSLIDRVGGATLVTFRSGEDRNVLAKRIEALWFADEQFERTVSLDGVGMEEFTDQGQARRLCEFFEKILLARKDFATRTGCSSMLQEYTKSRRNNCPGES